MHARRRILRLIWTTSVILSAIVFVAAMGMWGRSYWWNDELRCVVKREPQTWTYLANSEQGAITLKKDWIAPSAWKKEEPERSDVETNWENGTYPLTWIGLFSEDSTLGFRFNYYATADDGFTWIQLTETVIAVPYWFIALLCLPLPLIAFRRWRKKRRIEREGLCHVCGYDLRASESRCPECGTGFGSPNEQ